MVRRRWSSLLASGVLVLLLPATETPALELLVGTYTQGASEGIYRFRFDSATGLLDPRPLQVLKTANPSWLVLSADQRRVYAVNENGPGQVDPVGRVSSFAIDPQSRWLSPLNQVPSQGDEPTHASLSRDERYLFVANYAVQPQPGGNLAVLKLADDGRLAAVMQRERQAAQHQASSHPHSVVSSADGRYVFVSDLGADRVFVYRYRAEHPIPLEAAAAVVLPTGSGPRHLWFGVGGRHVYLTLELSAQVAVFDYREGRLERRQLLDLAAGRPASDKAAGALHGSADGRFLYVSNRGTANQLLVFAIDPDSGELDEIQRRSVEGIEPREFSLDPTGRFVLVANQRSHQVVVLARDPATGLLGEVIQRLAIDSPAALQFLSH